ncbi:dehydrodolichyl diphosphate synthase complex subunit Nus1 [Anopheles darlingi]|uniref:ditrans,polycis-polyprenyl diphosphate synthase [(2E,6E)-farnesyldiphosphate specific] n=1 Tax=Anopheles darlingi TaxID=43151 RepID=A0A2M4CVI8_ANODA|nr:dehydrodolichyl diphosphate synthase complex subunit Nus1 [Anopheles darlingi]
MEPWLRETPGNKFIVTIWSLLHYMFTWLEYWVLLMRWCRRAVFHLLWWQQQPSLQDYYSIYHSQLFIQQHLTTMSKVPKHLVVLLGPEEPDYRLLSQFVFWSRAAGIHYVSFYDHRGILKRNHENLVRCVQTVQLNASNNIVWTPSSTLLPSQSTPSSERPQTTVSFYSPADGKQELVVLSRSLGELVRSRNILIGDINVEFLDQQLQSAYHHTPDPDLALYFGDICSTYGLLPWQIRLTEFFALELRLRDITVMHFMNCLLKFSRCQQRFGT